MKGELLHVWCMSLVSYVVIIECVDQNQSQLNYMKSLSQQPESTLSQHYNQQPYRDPNYSSNYDRQMINNFNSAVNNRKDNRFDAVQGSNLQSQGNRQNSHQGNYLQGVQQPPIRPEYNAAVALNPSIGRYDENGHRVDIPSTNKIINNEQREDINKKFEDQNTANNQEKLINAQKNNNQPQLNNRQSFQNHQSTNNDRLTFKDDPPERVNYGQMPPPGTKKTPATDERNSFLAEKQQPEVVITRTSVGITKFGLNLLKNIDKPGNAIISPLSIATSLALLQQGALGETQYQISTALGMTPDESAAAYKELTNAIRNRASRNTLKLATSIFTASAFNIHPVFRQIASQNFASDIAPMTFERPVLSAIRINRWVAERTQNFIKELVTPDILTPDTQLVLANAVFFKGLWKKVFDPKMTLPTDFHLSTGETKKIPFMRLISPFRGGIDKILGALVVVLPFEDDQYSLMFILPTETQNLDTVIRNLDDTRLLSYLQLPIKDVKLTIPRFTIRGDTDLKSVLQKMGIKKMFEQQADLSSLEASGKASPKISSAVHTAVLSIDEKGGTAAAATAFVAVALSSDDDDIYFKADRPFLGVLWDNQLGTPLFVAKIEDPSG